MTSSRRSSRNGGTTDGSREAGANSQSAGPLIPPTPRYLIAPTEPKALRSLGITTLYPETLGCDVISLTFAPTKRIGFQRKEVGDFLASLSDGRLSKELGQMRSAPLSACVLLLEGSWFWTTEGTLSTSYGRPYTRKGHRNLLLQIQSKGLVVLETDSITDTIGSIQSVTNYLSRTRHGSLTTRPKTDSKSSWGRITNESFASHLLQSFPGIGPETAKAIYGKFGKAPLQWECTSEDLQAVAGIGKKTADRLMEALR